MPGLRIAVPVLAALLLAGCDGGRQSEPPREPREETAGGGDSRVSREASGQHRPAKTTGQGRNAETGGAPQQPENRNPLVSAEDTVRAFLELDGTGVRLRGRSQSRMLPYVAWSGERQADTVIVITGYDLIRTERENDTLIHVTVRYAVLGKLSRNYQKRQESETMRFTVRKTDAGWKISAPDALPPHVFINPAVTYLEQSRDYELADQIQSGRND